MSPYIVQEKKAAPAVRVANSYRPRLWNSEANPKMSYHKPPAPRIASSQDYSPFPMVPLNPPEMSNRYNMYPLSNRGLWPRLFRERWDELQSHYNKFKVSGLVTSTAILSAEGLLRMIYQVPYYQKPHAVFCYVIKARGSIERKEIGHAIAYLYQAQKETDKFLPVSTKFESQQLSEGIEIIKRSLAEILTSHPTRCVDSIIEELGLKPPAEVENRDDSKRLRNEKWTIFKSSQLSLGDPVSALTLAKAGLRLPQVEIDEPGEDGLLRAGFHYVMAEANRQQKDIRNATIHLHEGMKLHKSVESNLGEEMKAKHLELEEKFQKLNLLMHRETSTNICSNTQAIGVAGGTIQADDVTITFPKNSLLESSLITIETVASIEDMPHEPNMLQVSPILQLAPNMDLRRPAEVTLATWLRYDKSETDPFPHALLRFRKSKYHDWQIIQVPVTLCENGEAKFSIIEFCDYSIVIDLKCYMNWQFSIQSCLFVDPNTKKLSNRLIPKCSTCYKSLLGDMEKAKYIPVCTSNPIIKVEINDEVQIALTNIQDKKEQPDLPHKRVQITTDLLKDKQHETQDFLMDKESEGIVDFTHTISLYRQDKLVFLKQHDDDRVKLGEPVPTITGNVIEGVQTVHVHQELQQ